MSFFFVCWHSRKWWPPIRGGTLQMLVLWPEKLNQIDSFCKSVILYAWGGPRSIERCKKHGAPPRKKQFFPGLSVIFSVCPEKLQQPIRPKWFWPKKLQLFRPKSFWPEKLQQPIRPKWFGSPFCWRGSPFGPHFTENWVPILKKVCPQGLWPQCRY